MFGRGDADKRRTGEGEQGGVGDVAIASPPGEWMDAKWLDMPANTASKIKRRIEARVLAVLKMYE